MTTQKIFFNYADSFNDVIDTLAAKRKELRAALIVTLETWYQRGKQRQQLGKLTAEQLDDIGINREQADAEAAKLFWEK